MNRVRILLVDDSKANIYSLQAIFEDDKYITYAAQSGKECLEKLLTERIDIVLMDIIMPEMDGFETAHVIRSNPKTKHVPIIFVTGISQSTKIDLEGYSCGAFDIIYKPINKDILIHKINLFHEMFLIQRELEEQVKVLTELNKQNKLMREEIEKIASVDYLTNIANRRVLDNELSNRYIDAYQENKPISLLMMDLDNFKKYNDYFGHQKGDIALKSVAKTANRVLDKNLDFIGRYGGEEFLVILFDTDKKRALNIAETIIQEILNLKLKHSPICDCEHLTISIGATTVVPNEKTSINKLINAADEALYIAKNNGRNQVAFK